MANKTYSRKNQDKLKVYLDKQTKNGSKNIDIKPNSKSSKSNSRGTPTN
jgi:hypothetical protein